MEFIIISNKLYLDLKEILSPLLNVALSMEKSISFYRGIVDSEKISFEVIVGDIASQENILKLNCLTNDPFMRLRKSADSDYYAVTQHNNVEFYRIFLGECDDMNLLYNFCLNYLTLNQDHLISFNGSHKYQLDYKKIKSITYRENWWAL